MRAVLIDDEVVQRKSLKTLLSIFDPEIEIVGEASGVDEGVSLIKDYRPDLVFLDIEIHGGSGFDLLERLDALDFALIFVTGHNEFALKAFKYSAIDYVMKPLDPLDLEQALKKLKRLHNQAENSLRVQNLLSNLQSDQKRPLDKLILSDAESLYLIEVIEIIRCQAESNYTRFFLTEKREILVSKTMKEYELLLEGHPFFRVHQSHLINLKHFSRLDKREGGTIVMKDGSTVPVAVRRKDELLAQLRLV